MAENRFRSLSPDIISNALPWIQDDNDASHVGLAGGKYEMDGQQAGVVWMDGQQMWSVYETDRRTGRTAKPEEQGGTRRDTCNGLESEHFVNGPGIASRHSAEVRL